MEKKPISAKIPKNLFLEIQNSGKGTTECVIGGLELLFSNSENPKQEQEKNTNVMQEVLHEKERLIESLQDNIEGLQANNKFLQMEVTIQNNRYDGLSVKLLGSPGQQQVKRWWEIWK